MNLNKPLLSFAFLSLPLILFAGKVFAEETPDDPENKLNNISQYCETIKSGLKRLAVSDSKTRTYYGGIYETISSKYITPLNLRLVKNDYPLTEFLELQSSISTARASFSADFIDYSKSLEELTTFDCKNNPSDFYNKLEKTRKKRATLRNDVSTLNSLIKENVSLVKELKGSLNAEK